MTKLKRARQSVQKERSVSVRKREKEKEKEAEREKERNGVFLYLRRECLDVVNSIL